MTVTWRQPPWSALPRMPRPATSSAAATASIGRPCAGLIHSETTLPDMSPILTPPGSRLATGQAVIPTEPIGSIPRPLDLIDAVETGNSEDPKFDPLYDAAIRDTIARFEETGSPVITDGEQRKYHNFWTYSVHGLPNTAPDGFKIPFSAGHTRRMPRLISGPFRYRRQADTYLDVALRYATRPVKQAVISPSALSLMYPADGIVGYPRDQFIADLLD